MRGMRIHCVHTCSKHWASKKIQILTCSQIEDISGSTRCQDMTLYIKFNIMILL
jgi:hypothetical protein